MTWERFRSLPDASSGERIAWGRRASSFGELALPSRPAPHPVAVVVHGGCWRTTADLTYMRHLAAALVDRGWATWSIEFRRVDEEDARWPAILEDVGAGIDHLRVLAREYPLDLGRVVATGHSSGGHLALWAASRHRLPDSAEGAALRGKAPLRLAGIVGLAPITGLEDFHRRRDRSCPDSAVSDLLGGGDDLPADRLRLADPALLAPLDVPQLLLIGSDDDTVPPAHVHTFAEGVSNAGDRVVVVEVEGAGHFEVVAPWTPSWRTVVGPAIDTFLAGVEG